MLLARLLSKIFKKNGIILIDSQNQKYICGKPDLQNPLTLRLLKKDLNWKLVLNPDLNFPEAYMRGEIKIENGSLLDFFNMTFENIGRGEINIYGHMYKRILHTWRFFTNYNLPTNSKIRANFSVYICLMLHDVKQSRYLLRQCLYQTMNVVFLAV